MPLSITIFYRFSGNYVKHTLYAPPRNLLNSGSKARQLWGLDASKKSGRINSTEEQALGNRFFLAWQVLVTMGGGCKMTGQGVGDKMTQGLRQ